MSERLVFLIDPDPKLSGEITSTLHGYGLTVTTFPDGNEALASKDEPVLIILCIDPKRLGWGVCNRMKKSPTLKSVPLLVTSAEASEKDFDDHKQLKNRAEAYLRKPFTMEALVKEIAGLGLELGGDDAVEIPIADDIAIEDVGDEMLGDEFSDGERTGVVNASDFLVDKETEAAFDAIGADAGQEPPADVSEEHPLPGMTAHPSSAPPPAAAGPAAEVVDELGLDEMAAKVEESSRMERLPGPEGEIARLRAEVAKLQKELEEAKSRPSGGGQFSRDREFLGLREVINKKEKEILDLKDQVDARDRQLLDQKDKLRELDRARRDLDEKSLAVERELVAAKEKLEALARDKETAQGREKQLKARLDEAQKKLDKAYAEVDDWKTRHATDVEAAMQAAAQASEQAQAERSRLGDEFAALKRQLEEQQKQKVAEHERALAEMAATHDRRIAEAKEAHSQALLEHDQAHGDEIAAVRAQHAELLEQLEEQHRQDLVTADRVRADELAQKTAEHEKLVHQLEEQRHVELTAARAAAQADLQRQSEEHIATVERLKGEHAQQISEQLEQHTAEREQLRVQSQAYEARVRELEREANEAKKRATELEDTVQETSAQAATLASELAAARNQSDEQKARVTELEAESAKLQEQVLQAYQRLRNDEAIVTRAKKALAIALTLLDTNGTNEERKPQ